VDAGNVVAANEMADPAWARVAQIPVEIFHVVGSVLR